MPFQAIPFVPNQESGHSELAGGSPIAHNVVIDKKKAVRRRPGLTTASGVYTGVINSNGLSGIYKTLDGRLWAVSNQNPARLYEVGPNAFHERRTFVSQARPVFAETEALLVIANGDIPQKVVLATSAYEDLEGAPYATHIIGNSSRLVGNDPDNPSRVSYSGFAAGSSYSEHEDWEIGAGDGGFVSAEARPDPVKAVHENTNDVFAFGTTNTQVFSPDAITGYVPTATREYGLSATYSVIKYEQSFAWLDHQRRFVVSDGRTYEVISVDIQRTLDELSVIDDCFGYRVRMGSIDCLVWSFPTDGRSFVFQQGLWSQWTGWSNGNWSPLSVRCHFHEVGTTVNLVGTADGKIGRYSLSSATDFGSPIRAYIETGYLDAGTDNRKHCRALHVTLKRGETTGSTSPLAWVWFRDKPGAWRKLPVRLGASGARESVVTFRSLGTYRRRQWAFEFSGPDDLELVSAKEEYEVLEV